MNSNWIVPVVRSTLPMNSLSLPYSLGALFSEKKKHTKNQS